jgi:hypothetical protein
LAARDDNATHVGVDLPATEDHSGKAQVLQTTIGAGAYDDLIDLDVARLAYWSHVLWQMRERHLWLNLTHVDLYDLGVGRIGVSLICLERTFGTAIHIGTCDLVYGEEPRLATSFDGLTPIRPIV